MRPALQIPLLIALAALASCGMLPDDHALPQALGRSTRRMIDSFGSFTDVIHSVGRDVRRITDKAAELPEATVLEVGRLRNAGGLFAEDRVRRLSQFVPHTKQLLADGTADAVQRLTRLPTAPGRIGIDVERNFATLRTSLADTPRVLGLENPVLVDPDGPERSVEIVPDTRQRSWLERAIDRIGL